MSLELRFFVPGIPVPKGSAKAFVVKGRAVVCQDNASEQKPWASSIGYTAMQEMRLQKPIPSAVAIALTFIMPRPKAHYGTGKNISVLKDSARQAQHISKPDLDKLIRCVKDALTSIVWNDDSQVTEVTAAKVYESASRGTGVHIQISERS